MALQKENPKFRLFKSYIIAFFWIGTAIFIDQITKYFAVAYLKNNHAKVLIDGVFELQYLENRGMAFGILQNKQFLFVVGALDHVDDFLAVPHAQIADAVVLFVLLCQVVQKLRDDIVKFPLGHHALAQFAQSVREAVAVVLILVHIAVEPERVEKAIAGAFLNAHAFCHAGHGNGFFLHQIFKYLQAFFKRLDKSVAVLGHTLLTSKVGRGKSTPGGRAANQGLWG